jgi:hypothetical protein
MKHVAQNTNTNTNTNTIVLPRNNDHPLLNQNGWIPFLCEALSPLSSDKNIINIIGSIENQRKSLFTLQKDISVGMPFFIKFDGTEIFISTIALLPNEIKAIVFKAYTFESNLHSLMNPRRKNSIFNSKTKRDKRIIEVRLKSQNSIQPPHARELRIAGRVNTIRGYERCNHCERMVKNLAKHIKKAHSPSTALVMCAKCNKQVENIDVHDKTAHSPKAEMRRLASKEMRDFHDKVNIVLTQKYCKECGFSTPKELVMLAHIISKHGKDLRRTY